MLRKNENTTIPKIIKTFCAYFNNDISLVYSIILDIIICIIYTHIMYKSHTYFNYRMAPGLHSNALQYVI